MKKKLAGNVFKEIFEALSEETKWNRRNIEILKKKEKKEKEMKVTDETWSQKLCIRQRKVLFIFY